MPGGFLKFPNKNIHKNQKFQQETTYKSDIITKLRSKQYKLTLWIKLP